MRRAEILEGVRMLKLRDVLSRWESKQISQFEAAELMGVSERTFRRWARRFEEEGEAGLVDRRLGKPSPRRVPAAEAERVAELYRTRYGGFTAKHFHERLVGVHGFSWGYTWTKTFLHGQGLLAVAARRGAHRRKRPRRPLRGMMLHQDGSRHEWLSGHAPLDLIVTLDDATGEIYSAFLVAKEGTHSTLQALREVISQHGLPCSLYTDRGSHYFVTPKAGEKPDPRARTQVGRALAQLGIEHIPAFSPEARGRSERALRTLQDRLPKELAVAGITTTAAADRYLREVFVPAYNARFSVVPEQPGSAFVAIGDLDLDQVLCLEEPRQVGNDNTVTWRRRRLQIPASSLRPHFVRAQVKVRQHLDGSLSIFHGPRCIARYRPDGQILDLAA
jgi:transposase